jgi:hypothetical protein
MSRLGKFAVGLDQGDKGDGHVEQAGRQAGDSIEALLPRGVQQLKTAHRLQSAGLIGRQRSGGHRGYGVAN